MSTATATKRQTRRPRTKGGLTPKGARLVRDLDALLEVVRRGEPIESRFTVRTVRAVEPPGNYGPAEVKATRGTIGASQAVFARVMGVSADLVQGWEQGHREPSPLARRMLDEVNRDPARWKRFIGTNPSRNVKAG